MQYQSPDVCFSFELAERWRLGQRAFECHEKLTFEIEKKQILLTGKSLTSASSFMKKIILFLFHVPLSSALLLLLLLFLLFFKNFLQIPPTLLSELFIFVERISREMNREDEYVNF